MVRADVPRAESPPSIREHTKVIGVGETVHTQSSFSPYLDAVDPMFELKIVSRLPLAGLV